MDASPPGQDAGADAAPGDQGIPPECTEDSDCDDNDVCTGEERCEEGSCVRGAPLSCAGTACSEASCDPQEGCRLVDLCTAPLVCSPVGQCIAACDGDSDCDGFDDPCTDFVCSAGRCEPGSVVTCPGQCGVCEPDTGECVPDDAACGTDPTPDNCAELKCVLSNDTALTECRQVPNDDLCFDSDAYDCTIDLCRPGSTAFADRTGCVHIPNDSHCSDTFGDCGAYRCSAERGCVPVLVQEACGSVENCTADGVCQLRAACDPGTSCDDGNPCNGVEYCDVNGLCVKDGLGCPDPNPDDCLAPICDLSTDPPACDLRRTEACFSLATP